MLELCGRLNLEGLSVAKLAGGLFLDGSCLTLSHFVLHL